MHRDRLLLGDSIGFGRFRFIRWREWWWRRSCGGDDDRRVDRAAALSLERVNVDLVKDEEQQLVRHQRPRGLPMSTAYQQQQEDDLTECSRSVSL